MKKINLFILILFLFITFIKAENFKYNVNNKNYNVEAVSGNLIVKIPSLKDKEIISKKGYKILNKLIDDYYLVSFSTGIKLNSVFLNIENLGYKTYPNKIYHLTNTPNDPLISNQYYLAKTNAYTAWNFETGYTSTVTIAVMDSGIYPFHNDLKNKISSTGNVYISADGSIGPISENPPNMACFHGTSVSGVIGAETNNNLGIAGYSWGSKVLSVRVFDDASCNDSDCSGSNCGTTDSAIIKAINYIANLPSTYGKIIINMSLGGAGPCDGALQASVDNAFNKGIILVASAGNDSLDVNSPANCTNVIAVSATDENDNLAYFSSRGPALLNGVSAPGVNIYTTYPNDTYNYVDGTSFSAPIVSGILALMWSFKPNYTNYQIIDILKRASNDLGPLGPDTNFGWGRVNAFNSLYYLNNNAFSLSEKEIRVFPNPFYISKNKIVSFYVPEEVVDSDLKIQIYSFNNDFIIEIKNFNWNGKNSAGIEVASGPYIVLAKSKKGSAKGKFLLIR